MEETKEISKGRPNELNVSVKYKENKNQYAKEYYYLKCRELKHCDLCNRDIVVANLLKHSRTKKHIEKLNLNLSLEKNI